MTSPTAEWEKVGDKFYRKIQLYTAVFDQDLELENYVVTGCSYGGAIGALLTLHFDCQRGRFCQSYSTGRVSKWSLKIGKTMKAQTGAFLIPDVCGYIVSTESP